MQWRRPQQQWGGGGNDGASFQQPAWFGGNGASTQQPTCPPTPYKRWENWNYCHTHGGDVDDTHMSALCGNRCPTHNPNATHANMMGGSIAGMHKTVLPLVCGHTPPPPVAPSSSNAHNNAHQCHNTLSKARRNLVVAGTVCGQPCPCWLSSLVKA